MTGGYKKAILLAGFVMALAGSPAAARPLSTIEADGILKVGLTGDYAPFSLRDAQGNVTGADVTMARALADALGVKLLIVPTTWKSLQADLQSDRYDIAMGGVSVTPDREAIGDFSVPLMRDGKRPIVRCADKERYTSIAAIDKPDVRVVVNPGGTNERFAKAHFTHASLAEHPDNRTIFQEVAEGRADVMVTDGAEVDYQSRLHAGVLCPAAVPDAFDHAAKAWWMTKDQPLKDAVDQWLAQCLKDGCYETALKQAATAKAE